MQDTRRPRGKDSPAALPQAIPCKSTRLRGARIRELTIASSEGTGPGSSHQPLAAAHASAMETDRNNRSAFAYRFSYCFLISSRYHCRYVKEQYIASHRNTMCIAEKNNSLDRRKRPTPNGRALQRGNGTNWFVSPEWLRTLFVSVIKPCCKSCRTCSDKAMAQSNSKHLENLRASVIVLVYEGALLFS